MTTSNLTESVTLVAVPTQHSHLPAVEVEGGRAGVTAEQVAPIPTGITVGVVLHPRVSLSGRGDCSGGKARGC